MRTYNNWSLAALAAFFFLALVSCKNEGWKTAPSGLKYWIQKDEPGETIKEGDIVQMHVKYATSSDSVLFNSFTGPKPITMKVPPSQFKGSFEEAITLLSAGDSAQFMVSVDSIFALERGAVRPPFIDSASYLTFTVKIVSSENEEAFKAKQDKEREQQEKERAQNAVKQKEIDDQLIQAYVKEKGLKTTKTDAGVYISVVKEGKGEVPSRGDTVVVHYTGRTLEGKIFDSSRSEDGGQGAPFDFVLGVSPIIQGWQDGIAQLKQGGKAILIIPSPLAYGEQETPKFGPNSVLTFDVDIVKIVKSKK